MIDIVRLGTLYAENWSIPRSFTGREGKVADVGNGFEEDGKGNAEAESFGGGVDVAVGEEKLTDAWILCAVADQRVGDEHGVPELTGSYFCNTVSAIDLLFTCSSSTTCMPSTYSRNLRPTWISCDEFLTLQDQRLTLLTSCLCSQRYQR